jgi:hypothetical protein
MENFLAERNAQYVSEIEKFVRGRVEYALDGRIEAFKIEIQQINGYIFAVSNTLIPKHYLQHYGKFCFNANLFNLLIYEDMNCVDKGIDKSIQDVITSAQNYFAHNAKKLSEIKI